MWIYVVTFFLVQTTRINCPNGVDDCMAWHTRTDTVVVKQERSCQRWLSATRFRYMSEVKNKKVQLDRGEYGNYAKYDFVKLDSIYQSN